MAREQSPFFERILCANGSPQDQLATLGKLSFWEPPSSYSIAERLFSVLAKARTTRSVRLSFGCEAMTVGEEATKWEHLAFAFFSKHAHSSVEHLSIKNAVISAADAEKVGAVLGAPNPSRHVFGARSVIGGERPPAKNLEHAFHSGRYMVREGSTLSFEVMSESETRSEPDQFAGMGKNKETAESSSAHIVWKLATNVDGVRILQEPARDCNGQLFVNVLVPGFGVCWVPSEGIIDLNSPDALPGQAPCGITSLKLSFANSTKATEGLDRILAIVGLLLTRLKLSTDGNLHLDAIHLLKSCPNLVLLSTKGFDLDKRTVVKYCQRHHHPLSELNINYRRISF